MNQKTIALAAILTVAVLATAGVGYAAYTGTFSGANDTVTAEYVTVGSFNLDADDHIEYITVNNGTAVTYTVNAENNSVTGTATLSTSADNAKKAYTISLANMAFSKADGTTVSTDYAAALGTLTAGTNCTVDGSVVTVTTAGTDATFTFTVTVSDKASGVSSATDLLGKIAFDIVATSS